MLKCRLYNRLDREKNEINLAHSTLKNLACKDLNLGINNKNNQCIKEPEDKIYKIFSKSWSNRDINYTIGVILIII